MVELEYEKENSRDKSCEKQFIAECKFDIDECFNSAKRLCRKR